MYQIRNRFTINFIKNKETEPEILKLLQLIVIFLSRI